jgi:hypothetical protein
VSDQPDQAALSARVAVDVAFSRLDRWAPGEQLDVAQTAAAAVDVSRRGGDEGSSAGVRRASLKAELFEQRREPIDHAGRAQMTTGRADALKAPTSPTSSPFSRHDRKAESSPRPDDLPNWV